MTIFKLFYAMNILHFWLLSQTDKPYPWHIGIIVQVTCHYFQSFWILMTILSYFIPWIFYISDYSLKRISPSIEHITISKFWCWSSPVGRLANHPDDVFTIFSGCLSTSRTRLRSQKCNENNTTWHEKLQSHPFFVKYTISIYAQ